MGYLRKIEYKIMQKDSYKIIHNCSGCGCKATCYKVIRVLGK
mgnify:CR=1 FL=1